MTDQEFNNDFDQVLFGDDPPADGSPTPTPLVTDGMTKIAAWDGLFGGGIERLELGAQERERRQAAPDPIAAAIESGTGGLALVDQFGHAELEIYARSTGVLERPFAEMNQRERTLSLVLDLAAAREGRKTRATVAHEAQEAEDAEEAESVFDDLDADEFTALVAGVKAGSLAALPRATRKAMKPFLSGR